jgi:hypothetical protein
MGRMRLAFLLVILLGACSFGGADGDDGGGGGGGGGDGDSNMDRDPDLDQDGVKDAVDNCVSVPNAGQEDGDKDKVGDACDNCPTKANPPLETTGLGFIQRDHDGDGRGDVCDLCPHIKATADTDADADGIGTACDPNDTQKNRPAEFNGFYEAPVAADWAPATNAGALADWELTQTADKRLWWRQKVLDAGRHQLIRTNTQNVIKEVYVDTTFRIHQVQPANGADVLRSAAVTYGFLRVNGTDLYFNCGLRHDAQAVTTNAASAAYGDDLLRNGELGETAWSGDLAERDVHVIATSTEINRGIDDDTGMACNASADAVNVNANAQSGLDPDGRVGLRTFGMTASFDYIFIVDRARIP